MPPSEIANRHLGWISAWGVVVLLIAGFGVATDTTASHPFSNGIWAILASFAVVLVGALYMTFSPLLGTWPFRVKGHHHEHPSSPTQTYRTPGHLGFASAGHGLVLDPESKTPRVKDMSQGPTWGGWQSGDLPVHVSSLGPSGEREMISGAPNESWVWTYDNVTLVNESDEHLTFHTWLVVATPSDIITVRELTPEPDVAISLGPRDTKQATFSFRLKLRADSEEANLHPGTPKELQLIEDGSKGRKLAVSYEERQE